MMMQLMISFSLLEVNADVWNYYSRTYTCCVDCKNLFLSFDLLDNKLSFVLKACISVIKYKVVFFLEELALKLFKYLMSGMSDKMHNFCF